MSHGQGPRPTPPAGRGRGMIGRYMNDELRWWDILLGALSVLGLWKIAEGLKAVLQGWWCGP